MLTSSIMNGIGANVPHGMLVIVDGEENGDINSLNANDVETIEVLKSAGASIYGMNSANGVLIITTKKGGNYKDTRPSGVLPIAVVGFYKAREFYSPKYEGANNSDKIHDLRSTVYWNPNLVTDNAGNVSFEFYNTDQTGAYNIVIQGIDDKGNLGVARFKYDIK